RRRGPRDRGAYAGRPRGRASPGRAAAAGAPTAPGARRGAAGRDGPVTATTCTLYRDRYGVPHAFADDLRGAYFGLGYAAAQDRPRTLPLHQAMLQGRLA